MKFVRIFIILGLAAGAAFWAWHLNRLDHENLAYSGYVEGEYVRLAAPVSGTLNSLSVQRGARVMAGTPLFGLDRTTALADRARAQATADRARADLLDMEKGARTQEIDVQRAALAEARAALKNTEIALTREQELMKSEVGAQARLDSAIAARDQAQARVAALKAEITVATLPARDDRIIAARRVVEEAEAAVAMSERRLAELAPVAPVDAYVDDTYYLPGAWVGANQPIVSLLPDDKRKLRFYVPEGEIAGIQPGMSMRFTCDGCLPDMQATVNYIAPEAEYTPPVIYSRGSREKLVFLVEARVEGGKILPLGLPIDVRRPE